jgi:hypothetical protein
MNTTRTEGSKYTGFRSAVDIAKDIRKDIKEEVAAGRLPKDLKVSVRSRYYSGGQSIDILWSSKYGTHVVEETNGYGAIRYSTHGQAIQDKLKAIGAAYNYDNSDAQSDYFDTLFYCIPQWDYNVKIKPSNLNDLDPRVAETFITLHLTDRVDAMTALAIAMKLEAQS